MDVGESGGPGSGNVADHDIRHHDSGGTGPRMDMFQCTKHCAGTEGAHLHAVKHGKNRRPLHEPTKRVKKKVKHVEEKDSGSVPPPPPPPPPPPTSRLTRRRRKQPGGEAGNALEEKQTAPETATSAADSARAARSCERPGVPPPPPSPSSGGGDALGETIEERITRSVARAASGTREGGSGAKPTVDGSAVAAGGDPRRRQAPSPEKDGEPSEVFPIPVSDEAERRKAPKTSQAKPSTQTPAPQVTEYEFVRKGPLSAEQEREVDDAFDGGPAEQVLVTASKTDLTRREFRCLLPGTWLNDEVINMYMQLLQARATKLCEADPDRRPSLFLNSFFLTKLRGPNGLEYNYKGVKRWTRQVRVFELDKLFFPVNIGDKHWCMAVIYVQLRRINYYDSMGKSGGPVTRSLLRWLEDENKDKNGSKAPIEPGDWTTVGTNVDTTPQQDNEDDCGVFSVSFASYISDDLPLDFHQADITQMRRRMVWSLLHQRLV